jgi:hypothetical protein
MWPDAKFIQIMRDPFSSTASKTQIWSPDFRHNSPGFGVRKRMFARLFPSLTDTLNTITTPYEWFLFEWRMYTEEGERLKRIFPEQYYIVRLEDAQRAPQGTFSGICEFTGLRLTDRLRRAYQTMLDPRVRLAKPQLTAPRCRELLSHSAQRWGYPF